MIIYIQYDNACVFTRVDCHFHNPTHYQTGFLRRTGLPTNLNNQKQNMEKKHGEKNIQTVVTLLMWSATIIIHLIEDDVIKGYIESWIRWWIR